ncbi:hypothetical protein BD413DRAFT_209540 [Trametes elegans]|nr:hypothetical protein BD413DRAFT_209540 [Trametes elegans]
MSNLMNTLVQARFNPRVSSYWLPETGRETAARIPTKSFWALRAHNSHYASEEDPAPRQLFVLSNEPSPYPFAEASMTIGPKYSLQSQVEFNPGAQLTVWPPIPTLDHALHRPVYIHTVPSLRINMLFLFAIHEFTLVLEKESMARFIDTANEAHRLALVHENEGHRIYRRPMPDDERAGQTECRLPRRRTRTDPTYFFGELHNPRSYAFNFEPTKTISFPEVPSTIYEEILLYKQICIDYRWQGVEATIIWVQEVREARPPHPAHIKTAPTAPSEGVPRLSPALHSSAKAVAEMQSAFFKTQATETLYLPFAFPKLRFEYPRIPIGRTKVVAFDLFGVVLDRQGAIRHALGSWAPFAPHIRDLTALYVETEAHLAYGHTSSAKSLPVVVVSALGELARLVGIPEDKRPTLISRSTTAILSPPLYPDATRTLSLLTRRGYTLVCIPPYSGTTLEHLHGSLPTEFAAVHVCPAACPPHYASSPLVFQALLQQCGTIVPGVHCDEILVVSAGIGRILAPAIARNHPTVLVKRPGNVEANVDFFVGGKEADPTPSLTVDSLEDLWYELQRRVSGLRDIPAHSRLRDLPSRPRLHDLKSW